jgi:phosphoglycolate phosphatase-like HAD superfamily hydrolase
VALDGIRVVFVDDGGVLNDNERRAPQWRRLLGEYLTPRLGATPEAWADANVGAFERSLARYLAHVRSVGDTRGIDRWAREERRVWLIDMCEQAGVAVPEDPGAFAIATSSWVSERVRADLPGAIEKVRELASQAFVLHMASGGLSWELDPYLRGMGIRRYFDRLYGPDLVDTYKNGPHYYAALLKDSRTSARNAVVVESSAEARGWAESVGVRTLASLADLR